MSKSHAYFFIALLVSALSVVLVKEFDIHTMSKSAMVDNIPSFAWFGILLGISLSFIVVGLGKKNTPKQNQRFCFLTILGCIVGAVTLTPWGWALWQVLLLFRVQ